jgi:hypothetical protein
MAFVLGACLLPVGCVRQQDQSSFAPLDGQPGEPLVQLRCAAIPHLERVAVHCYFVEFCPPDGWHRWEVWQNPGSDERSWGHVRRDLMAPASGVGAGPSWALCEWRGQEAQRLREALAGSPRYPHRDRYHYWPGPNSNTFASWVLREAGIGYRLPAAAWGK